MSELTFEQMLEDSFKNIHMGDVVEGTVISVNPNEIAVNINYKSDGIVSRNEFSNDSSIELEKAVKPGDTITVKVLKLNDGDGQVILSHKRVVAEKVSAVLEEAFNNKTELKATVSEVVKGGLKVIVDEVAVFIPNSLATDSFGKKSLADMAGQEVEFIISEFNPKKRRYIGDCRTLLLEKKAKIREEVLSKINVGDVIEGEVKNVKDFGAFVDIGGVDGLIHISEMSWGRVTNPNEMFKRGDKVKVAVKEISGEKIALTCKFPEDNPWVGVADKFEIGSIVKGTVARMTEFGAFVSIAPGVDALLHVSQISKARINKPSDVLTVGQEIEAEITDVNVEEKKISLSMKALLPDDEEVSEEE